MLARLLRAPVRWLLWLAVASLLFLLVVGGKLDFRCGRISDAMVCAVLVHDRNWVAPFWLASQTEELYGIVSESFDDVFSHLGR